MRLLGALLLVPVAIGIFVGGFAAADYYSGRKLWGFLEGDWFVLFGFIGAGACLAIAVDTARRAILGDSRSLQPRAVLERLTATAAAGDNSSDARSQRMDLARQAIETLRAASFPVYAVPPSQWHGDVMVGGSSGVRNHSLSIHMRYDDDLTVERPVRRIEVTSTGLEGVSKRSPVHSYLLFEGSYDMEIANFVDNIAPVHLPQDLHGVPNAGPRRPLPTVAFRDELFLERVAFDDHPELRLYRVQMPLVEVLVMGWNWDDEALSEFARKVQPIQEDEGLFAEMEAAEVAAWAKIDKRRGRDD